jgi:hypothetical protein
MGKGRTPGRLVLSGAGRELPALPTGTPLLIPQVPAFLVQLGCKAVVRGSA